MSLDCVRRKKCRSERDTCYYPCVVRKLRTAALSDSGHTILFSKSFGFSVTFELNDIKHEQINSMNMLIRKVVTLLNKSPMIKERAAVQLTIANDIHSNHAILYNRKRSDTELVPSYFNIQKKEKETFIEIIQIYMKEDANRKAQLQFIANALKYMDEFGVNKDLDVYKRLFNIFPKGRYIPSNIFQVMMFHYPKHQDVAVSILKKMEHNFVIPDYEFEQMIVDTFGKRSLVIRKCWSMLYWMPKFAHLNPWPVPQPVPTDPKVLATLAIEKMCSIDVQSDVTVYRAKDVPDAIDDTWIVSSQSKSQKLLLSVHPVDKALVVEGPFIIWVDKYYLDYYVLKGDPIKREIIYDDFNDVSDLKIPFWERHNFKIPLTPHEQEDGVYYAICATGTSSKDSLLSWIRCLQETNPILKKVPIMFKLSSTQNKSEDDESKAIAPTDIKQIPQNVDTPEK